MNYNKLLYIFFIVLSLNIFFFSTTNLKAKAFLIEDIEVSQILENDFNKDFLINKGFEKAFYELIETLLKSSDQTKIQNIKSNEIKSMIQSFSIKEEKFINKVYYLSLGVTFDKKKVFNYLEKKNIFPTQIIQETFLFVPIIINQGGEDLAVFSGNRVYERWNDFNKKTYLLKYLLPTEDLEDMNLIKNKSINIENYDFDQIITKYFMKHSIIALIFKNNNEIKVLSKIDIKNKKIIKNNTFKNFDFENIDEIKVFIEQLKIIYDDLWKEYNQINTSIKLPLFVKVSNKDTMVSLRFENVLNSVDLISSYTINKFDKDFIYYEIIFNSTPTNFLNLMSNKNYNFDTQKKVWILK